MRVAPFVVALCFASAAAAQELKPLPTGVILVPGAMPLSSDSRTPVPERSVIAKNVYSNAYFGLTYSFPTDWHQEFEGPPPSDAGAYVLADIVDSSGAILVTAQDLFFSLNGKTNAERVKQAFSHLPAVYRADHEPVEVTIADRKFLRYDYNSPATDLHWSVLSAEMRCHVVQFVFTSRDQTVIDHLVAGMSHLQFATDEQPLCIANYASADHVISRVEPTLTDRKFNPIPVRIIIGKTGKVEHVHVISAFKDQAQIVTDALLQWRFKPYEQNGEPVRIETGILFGSSATRRRESNETAAASQ